MRTRDHNSGGPRDDPLKLQHPNRKFQLLEPKEGYSQGKVAGEGADQLAEEA